MKNALFILVLFISCKNEQIKNIVWSDGQTHFQITDSLVYFNLGPNRDYSYKIDNDTLFLFNEFCSYENYRFYLKLKNEKLIITEIDTLDDIYLKKYILEKNKNQRYDVSPDLSIQKVFKRFQNCSIEGSWYDSTNHNIIIFEEDSAFIIVLNPEFSAWPDYYKGSYKCLNDLDFVILSNCHNNIFEVESRDDSIIKLKSSLYEKVVYNRIPNVNINSTFQEIIFNIDNITNFDSIYVFNDSLNNFNLNQLSNP